MCEIDLVDIAFAYNDNIVLNHISMTIAKGDFLAVVGPNGAGKSTLLKMIAGILLPVAGKVVINGESVAAARQKGYIGYVPQNYGKNICGFPATVSEIVMLGLVGSRTDTKNKEACNHIVNHMLELVGCLELRGRRIGELSGGQQQRVMVARALAANPQLLLLDEPTSGIDFDASKKIFELLGHLNKALGITVVMVSHDLEKAMQWANKVACVNHGLCFFGDVSKFKADHLKASHLLFYTA